jgi:hypothetical protein
MTTAQNAFTITNPQTGNLAFKIFNFEDNNHFDHLQRNNYYSLIWIRKGNGKVKSDFFRACVCREFTTCFFTLPAFYGLHTTKIEGIAIYFHPDFYCIHMHQKEFPATVFCSTISTNRHIR